MEQPGFWDDVAKSTSVSRQLKKLQDSLEEYQKLEQDFSDIETLIQMAEEEGDSSMIEEIGEMLTAFQKEFENYRISLLLSGEFDGYDAVMTLHAGAGGTESCDWTSMLYRMYAPRRRVARATPCSSALTSPFRRPSATRSSPRPAAPLPS